VTFNGLPTTFSVDSDSQIRADVPAGATSGPIGVSSPDGSAASREDFVVQTGPEPFLEQVETGSAVDATSVSTVAAVAGEEGHLYVAAISTRPNRSVTSVDGLGLVWNLAAEEPGSRAMQRPEQDDAVRLVGAGDPDRRRRRDGDAIQRR
jgi:hypothetical protein